MQAKSDAQLLREYADRGAEAAFAELVARHTDLVYSAALRQVESPDLARDVAQRVFLDLARKAASLSGGLEAAASLAGWLYGATRFAGRTLRRGELRRQSRERQAMNASPPDDGAAPDWDAIRPLLDDGMAQLAEPDRDALLLRFFENQDFRAVGRALGISDDAAQKRVSRALERLREILVQRGVSVGAGGLAAAISTNAVQSAPVGLAPAIVTATASALSGTAVTAAISTATKTITMTTLQKTLVATALLLTAGAGLNEARQASTLREQVQRLTQQGADSARQVQQLTRERDDALNRLTAMDKAESEADENSRFNELLRLRGEIGALRSQIAGLEAEQARLEAESIQGQFRPRSEWADRGNEDPNAAVETMLWASSQGQQARLAEVVTSRALAGDLFPGEQPPIKTVGAVNLVYSFQNQEGTRAVVTAFVREDFIAPPGGRPYNLHTLLGWQLVREGGGWKIARKLFFDVGQPGDGGG